MDKEILKGSIDILVLSVLAKQELYGYEIAKRLKDSSEDLYHISEGTLYPALKRLEKKGFLDSDWRESESGKRRKYYTLTESGKKELNRKIKSWQQIHKLVTSIYGSAPA